MPILLINRAYIINVIKKLSFITNNWNIGRVRLAVGIGVAITAIVIAVVIVGTDSSSTKSAELNYETIVYATFYPYYEFASGVVGDVAKTQQLTPSGIEIHDWEPSLQDMIRMRSAAALVYSNSSLEPYVDKLADVDELANVTFIESSPYEPMADSRNSIPHSWLDPVDVISQVRVIQDRLADADPDNAQTYELNADRYVAELEQLDAEFVDGLSECKYNTIITLHNAFESLADRYELKIFAITASNNLEANAEPSTSDLVRMIEYARDSGAYAIFSDELTDSRYEKSIAEELGIDVIALGTLEGLKDGEQSSYFEKMQDNLDRLREGLVCL